MLTLAFGAILGAVAILCYLRTEQVKAIFQEVQVVQSSKILTTDAVSTPTHEVVQQEATALVKLIPFSEMSSIANSSFTSIVLEERRQLLK